MDLLTLVFDAAAALGGIYLMIGLVLHLVDAWGRCAPKAIALPLQSATSPDEPRKPTELQQIIDWNRRFGLGYGSEGA
ncbi:MAG: hypothetical protein AAF289_02070 [Cyanobacteria bacterium P01_A01_bin.135]